MHDAPVNMPQRSTINAAVLLALVASLPVMAIGAGWLGQQLLTLTVALMLLLLPNRADTDVRQVLRILKPLTGLFLLPLVWMLFQIVPLPAGSLGHPIWRSAAEAIGEPLAGHVSIDPGVTFRSLFGYASIILLVFVTAVLTRNRERAEMFLFGLCTITVFVAVWSLLAHSWQALRPAETSDEFLHALSAIAAFGAILNAAFVVRCVERHQTQRTSSQFSNSVSLMLAGIIASLTCLGAVILASNYDIIITTTLGLAVLGIIIMIRRLGLTNWTAATVCVAALVAASGIITLRILAHSSVSPIFQFVAIPSEDTRSAAIRIVSDANWFGAGVGNFSALAAIYRDATGSPAPLALNSIEALTLEWGYGGLAIAAAVAMQIFIILFWGALKRGRDAFYAAASAGCLLSACCRAFCDATFGELAILTLMALTLGLGLAQSLGRQFAIEAFRDVRT